MLNNMTIIMDEQECKCEIVALLCSKEESKTYVIYTVENKEDNYVGEIVMNNSEMKINSIEDTDKINSIWNRFVDIYNNR